MQERLQFGDVSAKVAFVEFQKRAAQRRKQVDMVVGYFTRWVPTEFWPGVDTPRSCYPKPLRHLPFPVLSEAARLLEEMKPA